MSVRYLVITAAAPYTVTPGRVVGTIAALVALAGVVIGGMTFARSAAGNGYRRSVVALAAGLAGMAGGGYVVAVAKGGPGTGYGVVGGYAALLFGLTAAVLGGLALARSRRTA